LKKAKKKRKDESEQDSDSKLDVKQIWRHAQATRRRRMLNSSPRQNSGGGRSPPGGPFIHHNFRYGPEPPAYKTPKPEYPSYTRREPERPLGHDRHHTGHSTDEKLLQEFMRRFWKEEAEIAFLQRFPQLQPESQAEQTSDPTVKDIDKSTRIPEEHLIQTELEPFIGYAEKRKQEPKEAELDPEGLLKQLKTYPTEGLREETLAQLNSEPKFDEEEIEGSKIETNALSTDGAHEVIEKHPDGPHARETEAMPTEQVDAGSETSTVEPLEHGQQSAENTNSPNVLGESLPEATPISEAEILDDVQDLMHELEPEIEEQEEVEPSY
jgi:hypothetical protein